MRILAFLTIIALALAACGSEDKSQAEQAEEKPADGRDLHTITLDGIPLRVEIAQDAETRTMGLMFREDLAEDEGMLFVFARQQILSFWMRNTFIPLDIAFISDEGKIVDIQRMEPIDESIHYISAAPALYALEVNAGWFSKHGIKLGSMVQF